MARRSALGRVVRGGVGRRRVQTAVIALTTLLSVAAAVLAVGLLVASQGPFDRAFAQQRGAHLTVQFDGSAITGQGIAATADATGVDATAGPFAVASVRLYDTQGAPPGFEPPALTVVGRGSPEAPVDRLELVEGRWAGASGEIVMERGAAQGGTGLGTRFRAGDTELTVVGIAESAGESADAWVVPAQLPGLAGTPTGSRPGSPPGLQMLYRLTDSATRADIEAGRAAIAAAVPPRAIAGTQSYLDVRQTAQENTAAFVPFITAFALLGLAMSVLVIGIVVSGAVGAATRRIGILKSLGFTPLQVGRAYVGQALIPASVGAVLGAALGNVIAVPLMAEVAEAYGTAAVLIPLWVDLVVPAGALVVVAATAFGPALRAARLRTVLVLGAGRTGGGRRGGRARHLLGRLPLPRPVVMGLGSPFARPARSATMAAAVAFGALAVTFAVGLGSTLVAVKTGGDPDRGGTVTVHTVSPPGPDVTRPPEPADPAKVAAAIQARSDTASFHRTAKSQVGVAGLKGGIPLVAYEGDTAGAGAGVTMVSGRWFSGPGEAVAAARFLQAAGVRVGETVAVSDRGRTVRLRIVGEVFDLGDKGMTLRTDASSVAALETRFLPADFSVELTAGTDPARYVEELNAALTPLGAWAAATEAGKSSVILAMQALIAMLTLMLVAVACLGVLNTVVLDTRDRVRDLGVLKALGMTPRQTVVQVLTSVGAIGVVAGAIGVPLGVTLHRTVMPAMGRAVGTTIPGAHIDVYGAGLLAALALAGVAIAITGALAPAVWAARTPTARALRTE
ncbi:ABC transporter permease [Streptomyces sp. NBC_01353]|uniref:ABC transporter permease n=1 Tax=Streptomyces sp. NBC_01353 TaxID=2903835 RepID=UPI002E36A2AB|nr:FtsX-like permease family protein [Streptomyces sp. NBC_01353]